jgi:hypothetical protein
MLAVEQWFIFTWPFFSTVNTLIIPEWLDTARRCLWRSKSSDSTGSLNGKTPVFESSLKLSCHMVSRSLRPLLVCHSLFPSCRQAPILAQSQNTEHYPQCRRAIWCRWSAPNAQVGHLCVVEVSKSQYPKFVQSGHLLRAVSQVFNSLNFSLTTACQKPSIPCKRQTVNCTRCAPQTS